MTSECTLIATKSRLTARCTREVGGCECGARGDELGGCALEDDASAVVPGAGPEIDEVIGVGHDRLMVFDDDDRAARIDEVVEQPEQIRDVGEVKTRRRFVEDDDRAASAAFADRWVASLSRCRSPPESVVSGWPRLR